MLSQNIKDWFGDGEKDVDLMLRTGVVTEKQVKDEWLAFVKRGGLDESYEINDPCEACGRIFKVTLEAGDDVTLTCECGHEETFYAY